MKQEVILVLDCGATNVRAIAVNRQGKIVARASTPNASDIAMEVTVEAVQIFGGYGYSEDYPVARLMRNAKITQIYEGTNQIQRVVMSRALLR